MGGLNIFKKDALFYQNLLVKIDKKLDYIPILSILTNTVDLIIRRQLKEKSQTLSGRKSLNNNAYYVHIHSKNLKRTLFLFMPLVGNFLVALMDFSRHQKIAKEKKGTTSDLLFSLAKRYLVGNGVTRDIEKSQKLFNQALIDLNNYKVRSFYALQYLEHIFTASDHPYTRAISLIKGIKEEEELSKLSKICSQCSQLWEVRAKKFESRAGYDYEELKEMKRIKQGYVNAAHFCEKQKEILELPEPI